VRTLLPDSGRGFANVLSKEWLLEVQVRCRGGPAAGHRFNASWGNGAGGVVSTMQDVSRFQRAFYQGKLLPPALQEILTGGPIGSRQSTSECGDLRIFGGSAPGYTVLTFSSTDAIFRTVETVLCRTAGNVGART
jgi:hypothetical protein